VAIDDEVVVLGLDVALVAAVGRVVLEHVDHVVKGDEGIVDGNDLDVLLQKSCTQHETTDASETVDADFDSHCGDRV